MKKLILLPLVFLYIYSFGQKAKRIYPPRDHWFVSVVTDMGFGGPAMALKPELRKQGFGDEAYSNFLGWTDNTQYPIFNRYLSLLVTGGKKIGPNKSVYITAGISEKGVVSGFRKEGSGTFLFLFSGDYGQRVDVPLTIYQLSGGYQYSFAKSRAKLGLGPSLFLLSYSTDEMNPGTNHSFVPGASFSARMPMGRERRLFGMDFFTELNLAPNAKMNISVGDDHPFTFKTANMSHLTLGFAFTFRN